MLCNKSVKESDFVPSRAGSYEISLCLLSQWQTQSITCLTGVTYIYQCCKGINNGYIDWVAMSRKHAVQLIATIVEAYIVNAIYTISFNLSCSPDNSQALKSSTRTSCECVYVSCDH